MGRGLPYRLIPTGKHHGGNPTPLCPFVKDMACPNTEVCVPKGFLLM